MINNKGFTSIEIFLVILVFSSIYIVGMVNVSHAFDTDYDELAYNELINLIEIQAEFYAENNENLFEDSTITYIYVSDLVEYGILSTDENGNVSNPQSPGEYLNNLKIKLINIDNKITASIVEI